MEQPSEIVIAWDYPGQSYFWRVGGNVQKTEQRWYARKAMDKAQLKKTPAVNEGIPEHLSFGEVVRVKRLNVAMGANKWSDLVVTYDTKKGHHFVCVVLGVEDENGEEMDTDKCLEALGWQKTERVNKEETICKGSPMA